MKQIKYIHEPTDLQCGQAVLAMVLDKTVDEIVRYLCNDRETTLKEMSELLGKETIDLYNTSETRSNQKSFGLNYQKTGKQLMTEDEIAVMDGGKCILQIRGARPFFSDKYDITKHKNYRLLADENEKNRYKVEKELNPQYTPKSEEEVEVIHVELSE